MPKKKIEKGAPRNSIGENVEISGAGITVDMTITDTLRENFMPYAMSVIVARALPEIDGFKPAHRKLLYTMYLMGLLNGQRTKSANVVGQTMKLNPHGDIPIYETMVRLTRGNETLLHPYVDSKGNFGKSYSRDMAYAAARYTEVKLAPIASKLFDDIGKDTVNFVDNYDNTMKEPALFPVSFPAILVNSSIGIAVGMACSIPSFNLAEVCETTVAMIKNPNHDIASTLKAPDFPVGGSYLYDAEAIREIYETGRGAIRIRSRYEKNGNSIEITEIPPTTTVEAIMDKIAELTKLGRIKEISDMRDETDLRGLRLTLDVKRGTNEDALMAKLFRMTPLEDTFTCNFTVLIDGTPRQIGVREVLLEWIKFRRGCVYRRTAFEKKQKDSRIHILDGLAKILLDIDKAIAIVRETKIETEVVPNLMIGFGIDEIQANYIAEIRLRHLNREYVLNRINEREQLISETEELERILGDVKRIDRIMIEELADIAKKNVQPRKTRILYNTAPVDELPEQGPEAYPVTVFFTKQGYFKKITPQSLRMSNEQRYKDGDSLLSKVECSNTSHLLFFTNLRNAYKCRAYQFDDSKASVIGDYVAGTLEMQEGEYAVAMAVTDDYKGNAIFFYSNGKAGKVPASVYETVQNRKKLSNAYSSKSEIVNVFISKEDKEYALFTSNNRMLLVNSALIAQKLSKETIGVQIVSLRKGASVESALESSEADIVSLHRFRSKNLPAAGAIVRESDIKGKGTD